MFLVSNILEEFIAYDRGLQNIGHREPKKQEVPKDPENEMKHKNMEEMYLTIKSLQRRLAEIKNKNTKTERKIEILKTFTPLSMQKDKEENGRYICNFKDFFSGKQSSDFFILFSLNLF